MRSCPQRMVAWPVPQVPSAPENSEDEMDAATRECTRKSVAPDVLLGQNVRVLVLLVEGELRAATRSRVVVGGAS